MKTSVSQNQRIRALKKCIDSWLKHDRIGDHDHEINSMIPNLLCLFLGYTLSMETVLSFPYENQIFERNLRNSSATPKQTIILLICEALFLIHDGCSDEARDESFQKIGIDLLNLLLQVIQWCLHDAYERDPESDEKFGTFNSILKKSVGILLAFTRTGFPRILMSNDDNALTLLSRISSNNFIPQEIREISVCILNNAAYDCYKDEIKDVMHKRAQSFSQFVSEITLSEESYVGKAREYVEAALWNLTTSYEYKVVNHPMAESSNTMNILEFIDSLANTINQDRNKLCIRRRGLRLLRCLSYGTTRTIMATHKPLINALNNVLQEDMQGKLKGDDTTCLCERATIDSSFYKNQILESRLEAIECLSYIASTDLEEGSSEFYMILKLLAKITCSKEEGLATIFSTKGLRSLAMIDDEKMSLANWPGLFKALVDICIDSSTPLADVHTSAETLCTIMSKLNSTSQSYQDALTSVAKVISLERNHCTELSLNVLLNHSLEFKNKKALTKSKDLLDALARVIGNHNHSVTVREKATELIKNLSSERFNGEELANANILSSLVKVASLSGNAYSQARHYSIQALIFLSTLVSNRRVMATQVGLLTSLIRYLRSDHRDPDLEAAVNDTIKKLTPAL